MECPICKNKQYEQLLSLSCGKLDESSLYEKVVVVVCEECGHVFNLLSEEDKIGIVKYYKAEGSLDNLHSPNTEGDLPGSSNENSINRYSLLFDFIKPYLNKDNKILDIGCAMGGFLRFLKEKNYNQLYGIDFSSVYANEAQKNKGLEIKRGTAEEIPFDDNLFDFLIADQVVEHLFDPNMIFIEARRVLKKGGYFCISVPNAVSYLENYFFDFYWFLMKEHIQHFDAEHLVLLGNRNGFSVKNIINTSSNMLSKEVSLPNLSIVFEYNDIIKKPDVDSLVLKTKIKSYLEQCYKGKKQQEQIMCNLYKSKIPLYIWGMSREFLYLYNNTSLKKCNIVGLIDDIPTKQLCTIDDMKIRSSEIVKTLSEKSVILITAYAHKEVMIKKLKKLHYKGRVYE